MTLQNFLTNGFIIGFSLGGVAIALTRNAFVGFFIGFPGVLGHELAHFLTAFVLQAAPKRFRLFPRKEEDGSWTLGSVVFAPHWWSAGLVALAPGYLLPLLAWWVCRHALLLALPGQLFCGYLDAVLLWSAFPSMTDWKIALRFPFGTLGLLTLTFFLLKAVLSHKI